MSRTLEMLALAALAGLSACAPPSTSIAFFPPAGPPAGVERLYAPTRVSPGRLEYAPDRSTFAPILTERFPYPTQTQANAAYLRLIATAPLGQTYPASIWLFGCKPGAIDEQTARVARYRGQIVHCATDFLDAAGHRLGREAVNFIYDGKRWSMEPINAPRSPVAWRNRERSPMDIWWWAPGRARYE